MDFDVTKYWQSIRTKVNDPREWNQLQPQEQQMIVQSVNLLLSVLYNAKQYQQQEQQ